MPNTPQVTTAPFEWVLRELVVSQKSLDYCLSLFCSATLQNAANSTTLSSPRDAARVVHGWATNVSFIRRGKGMISFIRISVPVRCGYLPLRSHKPCERRYSRMNFRPLGVDWQYVQATTYLQCPCWPAGNAYSAWHGSRRAHRMTDGMEKVRNCEQLVFFSCQFNDHAFCLSPRRPDEKWVFSLILKLCQLVVDLAEDPFLGTLQRPLNGMSCFNFYRFTADREKHFRNTAVTFDLEEIFASPLDVAPRIAVFDLKRA